MADSPSKKNEDERLKAALRGAFAGPPTPLKDIPKKGGESRTKKTEPKRKKKPGK